MHTASLHRAARLAAIAALTLGSTIASGAAATADASWRPGSAVEVKLSAAGLQAPMRHAGGTVTFRVETDDPAGRQLQIFRPHPGVGPDQVLHDFAQAVSHDPATSAAGIRAARADAEALGGALVTPQVPVTVSEDITPGTVYLVDFSEILAHPEVTPPVKALELCGDEGGRLPRFPHGIVIQQETAAGPRFQTEDVRDADGDFLVHNSAPELHEMQLQPVAPGTTDDQVQAFFDSLVQGNPIAPPFTGQPVGLGVISPDRDAVFHAHDLPPGTYVLLCFVPDDQLGVPHAFLGMHKIVQLG